MNENRDESIFTKSASRSLKAFDRTAVRSRLVMADRGHPSDRIQRVHSSGREHLAALLPMMRDPGREAGHLRLFTTGAAIQLAFYMAMKDDGQDVAEAWAVCEETARREIEAVPRFLRWIVTRVYFSGWVRRRFAKVAAMTQESALGGWVYEYTEGDGEDFDFAVRYTRCAIQELARSAEVPEFGPYLCLGDIIASDALGWGIRRSQTLGHGCTHCDFSFKRGGLTQISTPGWLRRRSSPDPDSDSDSDS